MKRNKIKKTMLDLLETYSADDLSVKGVCAEAGISKQTLYNNFYGILGVAEELVHDFLDEATEGFESNHYWLDGLSTILDMLSSRRNFFIHLYYSKYREELLRAIHIHIGPIVARGVEECAEKTGTELNEYNEKLLVGFYMDIFMGVIGRFIQMKMTDDPARIAQIYKTLMLDHDTKKVIRDLSNLEIQ